MIINVAEKYFGSLLLNFLFLECIISLKKSRIYTYTLFIFTHCVVFIFYYILKLKNLNQV